MLSPACVGLGRDCAEKQYVVASGGTVPDSSTASRHAMIAEKDTRDSIDRMEQ